MRLYAETNLILELVYEQAEAKACRSLLKLAEKSALELVLPAIALVEARQKLERDRIERHAFSQQLESQRRQLARSSRLRKIVEKQLQPSVLIRSVDLEQRALESIIVRFRPSLGSSPWTERSAMPAHDWHRTWISRYLI